MGKLDTVQTRIKALRISREMSIYRLAQVTGLTRGYLGRIEAMVPGRCGVSWDTACRVADALGVSVADLRGKDDGKKD